MSKRMRKISRRRTLKRGFKRKTFKRKTMRRRQKKQRGGDFVPVIYSTLDDLVKDLNGDKKHICVVYDPEYHQTNTFVINAHPRSDSGTYRVDLHNYYQTTDSFNADPRFIGELHKDSIRTEKGTSKVGKYAPRVVGKVFRKADPDKFPYKIFRYRDSVSDSVSDNSNLEVFFNVNKNTNS